MGTKLVFFVPPSFLLLFAILKSAITTVQPSPEVWATAATAKERAADRPAKETVNKATNKSQSNEEKVAGGDQAASVPGGGQEKGTMSTATSGSQGSQMILVENPRYNAQKPLLFDSGLEKDNTSCMVCHVDFEEEPISAAHLKAGITCMGCHGDSLAHRGDEFNVVRPDVIWGRAEMEPFCKQCHPQHRHPEKVAAYLKQNLGQRRENGRYVRNDSPCLDCHGKHAIVPAEGNFR